MFRLEGQRILSPAQLKRLSEHKYSCASESLIDPILQPYWNKLTSCLPLWLAPNLITVAGLIVNILTTLVLVWYCPDAKAEPPRWGCFLCALGLFIYQSLDAVDGKQARRTGSSSPLGELFDHGCDSISTVFVALSACIAVQLGEKPGWMLFQCFTGMTMFYFAHWQTYVSGTLKFTKVDVTEAQCSIMGIHLISAIFGSSIWTTKIPVVNLEIFYLMILFSQMCCGAAFIQGVYIILTGGCGRNGSTVAGTSVLSPVIPFGLVVVPAVVISAMSTQNVYEENPCLYILAFGMVIAKVTNRLVVAHMTKSEMEYLDSVLMGPLMLFLNQYFKSFLPEYYVLWGCMLWATFDLLRYCRQVCLEICDYLHIELFRIKPTLVGKDGEKNGMGIRGPQARPPIGSRSARQHH
ncbi:cholinephosphotransferase 1 isoform X1 [Neocloeon triangulifer]|uniref:cholinephosphotransferase 1 isoform X1 n=1 Tax=Neocloeon triangulifer TaxID=2078957 RepID=UPI00286EE3C9|nr:cholinephosphotransferase 1 isoform X1 [Neocloeon triangulifer]XP_059490084.1 cholinephosphotransferase 1 isoform X1 [Neocloeon triangulifer]